MKINLSKSMEKCIKEMQEHAGKVYKDLHNSKVLKIKRKPTKKKIFEFHITNVGKPMIKVIVNRKLYKNFIKLEKSWKEI